MPGMSAARSRWEKPDAYRNQFRDATECWGFAPGVWVLRSNPADEYGRIYYQMRLVR